MITQRQFNSHLKLLFMNSPEDSWWYGLRIIAKLMSSTAGNIMAIISYTEHCRKFRVAVSYLVQLDTLIRTVPIQMAHRWWQTAVVVAVLVTVSWAATPGPTGWCSSHLITCYPLSPYCLSSVSIFYIVGCNLSLKVIISGVIFSLEQMFFSQFNLLLVLFSKNVLSWSTVLFFSIILPISKACSDLSNNTKFLQYIVSSPYSSTVSISLLKVSNLSHDNHFFSEISTTSAEVNNLLQH